MDDDPLDDNSDTFLMLKKHHHTRRKLSRFIWTLLPSFVSAWFGHDKVGIPEASSTSYLNGLRGIAALIVAIQHNTNEYFPFNHRGYGDQPNDTHFTQLPFVRLILHGSFMVAIFFVISGFALSYGPLKQIYAGNSSAAISGLPSSVFRRPIRLFLPILPVLILSSIMIRLQIFYQLGAESFLAAQPSLTAELTFMLKEFNTMIATAVGTQTMPQGWTISTEYRGSILIFLCCLSFCRTSPLIRILFVGAILCYQMYLAHWELALFLYGMILADIRHMRAKMEELLGTSRKIVDVSTWVLFIAALFFGGWPIYGNGGGSMWYNYFAWVPTGNVPQQRFWHSVSAMMLITSLENLPALQKCLNWKPILYLGEISYGLYLVHWMVGMNLFTKGLVIRLRSEGYAHLLAWAAGASITFPLCFWVADLHWRLVDQKTIKLTRWLKDKVGI